ncbi:MAG: acyl-CoA thioesterase II [Bacteroidota bacterium]
MKQISELVDLLDLETIEDNIFRGRSYRTPWGSIFGGQVLAQALVAATRTVPADRACHSLHAYFILRGDIEHPVVYEVDRIRDGGSFTTRRVVAIQKGRPIFNLSASFQLRQEGLEHQISMPEVAPPEELLTDTQLSEKRGEQLSETFRFYQRNRPIEFRPVEDFPLGSYAFDDEVAHEPFRHVWIRAVGDLPTTFAGHRQLLAFASDSNLLGTALLPHRHQIGGMRELQLASLDHAMWFHRDFRMDDWLLYALESPSASNARGFARGNIFRRDGRLVASVVQEGLIRRRIRG